MVESRDDYAPVRAGLLELFERYGATYIVPFVTPGRAAGLLLLPEKQNLRQITAYEVGFINRIKSAATIALANSIMYSRLAMLKDNLEHLVEERTAELVKAMSALWGEMELAKKIQTVLLPRAPAISGLEIAAYMRPADEVGGDYYDVINAQGIDWLVIGDVSGHGVPAGLIMMMVQTAIHTVLEGKPNLQAGRGIEPRQPRDHGKHTEAERGPVHDDHGHSEPLRRKIRFLGTAPAHHDIPERGRLPGSRRNGRHLARHCRKPQAAGVRRVHARRGRRAFIVHRRHYRRMACRFG